MELLHTKEGGKLTISVSGRVDTSTAPELQSFIDENADGVTELVLDLGDMAYISSAGLRVVLKAQKRMNTQGTMKVINVRSDVMEIFAVTGFDEIINIEAKGE